MNLSNFIAIHQIKPAVHAGGPGSGRKPEVKNTPEEIYKTKPIASLTDGDYTISVHLGHTKDRTGHPDDPPKYGTYFIKNNKTGEVAHGANWMDWPEKGQEKGYYNKPQADRAAMELKNQKKWGFEKGFNFHKKTHGTLDLSASSSFEDTGKYDEKVEADRRSDAMFIGAYAENGPTYDPTGNYLCGTCKYRVLPKACSIVKGKISMTTGSCAKWFTGPASSVDDIQKHRYSQKAVAYTERPHDKGFGCKRCEYGDIAKKKDAGGRPTWCSSWGCHVMPNACCERNEGKDDVYPGGKIDAGGPGSGRHPSVVLEDHGWKRAGHHVSYGSYYTHSSLPKHTITLGGKHGTSWRHEDYGTKVARGSGGESLDKHLGDIKAGGPGSGRHSQNPYLNEAKGYVFRGTSFNEVRKVFEGGQLGEYWGGDFKYSTEFTEGYKGGGKGYVLVADQPHDETTGRQLPVEAQHVVAILNKSGKPVWERSSGFNSQKFKTRLKGSIKAAGTHEGAEKGWDTRGRGKAQQTSGKRFSKMSLKERIEWIKQHTQQGHAPDKISKPTLPSQEREYPHSGKGSMGVGKTKPKEEEQQGKVFKGPKGGPAAQRQEIIQAPIEKKSFHVDEEKKTAEQARQMGEWKGRQSKVLESPTSRGGVVVPPVSKTGATDIKPGMLVKTTNVTRAFNNDTLEFQNYKAGTTLFVKEVLPQVGNQPQMLLVEYPHKDEVHVAVNQVQFHFDPEEARRLGGELRPTGVMPQKTPRGAKQYGKLTVLPPSGQRGRPPGSGTGWKQGQPNPESHSLKGRFDVAKGPRGQQLKDILTFDTSLKSFGPGTAKASVYDARSKSGEYGATVIAWRDPVKKVGKILEFNTDAFGNIKMGTQQPTQFKNLGHMSSYLSKRYGVKQRFS